MVVLSIWDELSPHETDCNSLDSFKSSLTSEQLLRHYKVNFVYNMKFCDFMVNDASESSDFMALYKSVFNI